MMNSTKSIAAAFAMMICAGSMAMAQLPSTGMQEQRWQEPARLQVTELERTSSKEYSYLIFDFEAKTITLVKVDLNNSYTPITVTTKRLY